MKKLTREEVNRLDRARAQSGGDFDDLVKILGLRPELDFRFADLTGVEFGTADLRGFDFTGADLRGADFRRSNWNGACLQGATIDKTTLWTGGTPDGPLRDDAPINALMRSELRPKLEPVLSGLSEADRSLLTLLVKFASPAGSVHLGKFLRFAYPNEEPSRAMTSFKNFQTRLRRSADIVGAPLHFEIERNSDPSSTHGWFTIEPFFGSDIPKRCAFSSSGETLYLQCDDGIIKYWDWKADTLRLRLLQDGHIWTFSASPDGRELLTASDDGTFSLWNAEHSFETDNARPRVTFRGHSLPVSGCAFSRDGRRVASTSHDGSVRIWDVETASPIFVLGNLQEAGSNCAYSPDGSLVVSISQLSNICFWDALRGTLIRVIDGSLVRSGNVQYHGEIPCSFSPDGLLVGIAAPGRSGVLLWRTATGTLEKVLEGHGRNCSEFAFSPNGRHIAAAYANGIVAIWDFHAGECVKMLQEDPDPDKGRLNDERLRHCVFSRDGRVLCTTSLSGRLRIWDTLSWTVLATRYSL